MTPPFRLLVFVSAVALVAAACSTGGEEPSPTSTTGPAAGTAAAPSTTPPSTAPPTPTTADPSTFELPGRLAQVTGSWLTDFTIATIDLTELKVGIPASDPRDAIPPIDEPNFEPVGESSWLAEREPGAFVEVDGIAKFYPLSIMTRHEIVNDTFGDRPIAVTFCPLCNTALAFDPVVDGQRLRLGVSGLLRKSDLVMWDDVTQSLWQQITGEAIVGAMAGRRLTPVSTAIVSWGDFVENHPDGLVMSQDQGFGIPYGINPYVGYSGQSRPYGAFFDGDVDPRFPAMERVVGLNLSGNEKAYPFSLLAETRVANDVVGGIPIVVFWGAPDTADALDAGSIRDSQGIGTGIAFFATVDGQTLTFIALGADRWQDEQTGSTWNLLGKAVDGPLAGSQLEIAPHRNEFWFAWQGFFPDAPVWNG